MYYALQYDTKSGIGIGSHTYAEKPKSLPSGEVACTAAQAANPSQYSVQNGSVVAGSSLAQQATALLTAGLTINSTSLPAINGVYGCDDDSQKRANKVWSILKQNSDGFPTGTKQISWPLANGSVVVFTDASVMINAFSVLGSFVLQCEEVALNNAGTLPSASVTIP